MLNLQAWRALYLVRSMLIIKRSGDQYGVMTCDGTSPADEAVHDNASADGLEYRQIPAVMAL